MAYDPQDLISRVSQNLLLGNTTAEEQYDFISEQIEDPFNSGTANYFKKLKIMLSKTQLDEQCLKLLNEIEDRYPKLSFDLSQYDQHLDEIFAAVYKFFIINVQKLMFIFLREFIFTNKNRKVLVAEYMNTKLPNYPKEQYGKKEFYILITKLNNIINDIQDDDISLSTFIEYLEKSGSIPIYVARLKEYLDKGIIQDNGVVDNMFELMKASYEYNNIYCKLQTVITSNIINVYLEENGLTELRLPPVDPLDEEAGEVDDENESDE